MALRVRRRVPLTRRTPLAQRTYRREKQRQTARRLVIGVFFLVVLAGVVGAGYTWATGKQKPVTDDTIPEPKKRVELNIPTPSPTAKVGVAVQTLTSQVKPGENASITIRTNGLAVCDIEVKYKETKTVDSGLKQKTADEFGTLSWAWTMPTTAPNGPWLVEVTCKNKKHSAVVQANFIVKS